MDAINFCNKVVTIPQTGGTCWFTAILMSLLYSQHSRKLLYTHFEKNKQTDGLHYIFDEILKSYYLNSKKTRDFYMKYTNEYILDHVGIYEPRVLNDMKTNGAYPYIFLPKLIRKIGKSCLTLDYYNKNFYVGINEQLHHNLDSYGRLMLFNQLEHYGIPDPGKFVYDIKNNIENISYSPDYICVNMWDNALENGKKPLYTSYLDRAIHTPQIAHAIKLVNYNVDFDRKLYELRNEITYNGETYKLNSCILCNYNQLPVAHAIAGVLCKNTRYVYNGWTQTTVDPAMQQINGEANNLPCFLMKYDWNINNPNEKFCLNPRACSLDKIEFTRQDLCFSFGKGLRILLYVKDTSTRSIDRNLESSVKQDSSNMYNTLGSSKRKSKDAKLYFFKPKEYNYSSPSIKSEKKSASIDVKKKNNEKIKELLEINKKLLLSNKKIRSEIKELQLKIKLL
jgi:hypothetical protein